MARSKDLMYIGLAAVAGAGLFAVWKLGLFGSAAASGRMTLSNPTLVYDFFSGTATAVFTGSGAPANSQVVLSVGSNVYYATSNSTGGFLYSGIVLNPGSYTAVAVSGRIISNTVTFTV